MYAKERNLIRLSVGLRTNDGLPLDRFLSSSLFRHLFLWRWNIALLNHLHFVPVDVVHDGHRDFHLRSLVTSFCKFLYHTLTAQHDFVLARNISHSSSTGAGQRSGHRHQWSRFQIRTTNSQSNDLEELLWWRKKRSFSAVREKQRLSFSSSCRWFSSSANWKVMSSSSNPS